MKLAKFLAVLIITFAGGLLVGGWKSEIGRAFKIWSGLQDPLFGSHGSYYRSRLALFRQTAGDAHVVMLGDSITEGADWRELFPDVRILNRGISGDTSDGIVRSLDAAHGMSFS